MTCLIIVKPRRLRRPKASDKDAPRRCGSVLRQQIKGGKASAKRGGWGQPSGDNGRQHRTPINRPPACEIRTTSRGVRTPLNLPIVKVYRYRNIY